MKSIKLILPALVFVFAIVTAFASDSFFANDARGFRLGSTTDCRLGDLQPPPAGKVCSITPAANRCSVKIVVSGSQQIVDAFTTVGCVSGEELWYPN